MSANAELCAREQELLDALGRGYVGAELASHVESCAACSELHLIAGALLNEKNEAVEEARVPSAGSMLWRLQTRRRHEAHATARRTLLIGQAATLAIALGLVVFFFGAHIRAAALEFVAAVKLSTPLLLTLATWALIAPIAGWVAIRQK